MSTVKLLVKNQYQCRDLSYPPGIIEVSETLAAFLLSDAPENFADASSEEVFTPDAKAIAAPPADKMVRISVTKGSKRK